MLASYLNQTATLQQAARDEDNNAIMDSRGEIEYLSPVSIRCRKQAKTQEALTPESQIIKTAFIYYADTPVNVGNLLDGKLISTVSEWITLQGDTIGYKAVV